MGEGDTRPLGHRLVITRMCQLYNILITARITSIVCHSQLNNFIIHTNLSSYTWRPPGNHNSIFSFSYSKKFLTTQISFSFLINRNLNILIINPDRQFIVIKRFLALKVSILSQFLRILCFFFPLPLIQQFPNHHRAFQNCNFF